MNCVFFFLLVSNSTILGYHIGYDEMLTLVFLPVFLLKQLVNIVQFISGARLLAAADQLISTS